LKYLIQAVILLNSYTVSQPRREAVAWEPLVSPNAYPSAVVQTVTLLTLSVMYPVSVSAGSFHSFPQLLQANSEVVKWKTTA
jgi:hypothetical protein